MRFTIYSRTINPSYPSCADLARQGLGLVIASYDQGTETEAFDPARYAFGPNWLVSARVPRATHTKLHEIAKAEKRTLSSLVREGVGRGVAAFEADPNFLDGVDPEDLSHLVAIEAQVRADPSQCPTLAEFREQLI
jgi:hypothetical protein